MKVQSSILRERYLATPVNEMYTIGQLYDKMADNIIAEYKVMGIRELQKIAKVKKNLVKYYTNIVFNSFKACEMSQTTYQAVLIMFGRMYAVSRDTSYTVLRTKEEILTALVESRILECIFLYLFNDKHDDEDLMQAQKDMGYLYYTDKNCRVKAQRREISKNVRSAITNNATKPEEVK